MNANGCVMKAWHLHSAELRHWALKHVPQSADTDDLLQEVFFKALLQKERFCSIQNARAWLFRVTRNTLIDRHKLRRENIELPETLPVDEDIVDAVEGLTQCLPRVLSELSEEDREVVTLCDLNRMPQQQYAKNKGITLVAAKSRIQRARRRLRQRLEIGCQVRRDDTGNICGLVPRPPLRQGTN